MMKKTLIPLFCLFGLIYLVEYETHKWNPCSIDKNTGWGTCLFIYCPPGGCTTPREVITCADLNCVRENVNKRGTEYLIGVFEITLGDLLNPKPQVREMKIERSFDFK